MGKIKLDVGTNFDPALLDFIEKTDTRGQIVSMFGKLKTDIVGGGRASVALNEVSLDEVARYNARCRSMGIDFNYLLNTLTLQNRDIIPEDHRRLVEFIGALSDMGIRWLTVCSPYLLQLVKRQFSHIKVTIGIYAFVGSLSKAKSWVEMGADELTLTENCTRNFDLLEAMLQTYRDRNVKIRIIANNGCLHDCPYALNHAGAVSASSLMGSRSQKNYFDFSLVNCYARKVTHPANMIASDWIRPEDQHYYEALCERAGNDRLVLKLVERTKSTAFLCRVVKAYIEKKYEGNLLDIMNWIGSDSVNSQKQFDVAGYVQSLRAGKIDMDTLIRYSAFFALPDIYIDNQKLDGFLEHFIHDYQCDRKSCRLESDPAGKPTKYDCTYCREWAKKAVSIDNTKQKAYQKWIENARILKDKFNTSEIFNPVKTEER